MGTISNIKVENFLSLRKIDVRLDALNVLVGPNGAGKTNLLKVFQFLGEVARVELAPAISGIGGFDQLIFRGEARAGNRVSVSLTGVITQHASGNAPDEYKLAFWRNKQSSSRSAALGTSISLARNLFRPDVFSRLEELKFKRTKGQGRRITLSGGRVTVATRKSPSDAGGENETLAIEGAATGLGTLRRLSNAYGAAEWNSFAEVVEQLRLFEIDVERARKPARVDFASSLRPDGSNLAAFLFWLMSYEREAFDLICEDVRFVLPAFEGFEFTGVGGAEEAILLSIKERHLTGTTPLARASFGTIRAIALFAMLHDPHPPKLTCLEEIDHGLHPHALDRIVDRLRQASKRTQIILATHSPALVNRLSPNELIIAEREEETGGTRLFRPSVASTNRLRESTGYELGELWFSGALGGGL